MKSYAVDIFKHVSNITFVPCCMQLNAMHVFLCMPRNHRFEVLHVQVFSLNYCMRI